MGGTGTGGALLLGAGVSAQLWRHAGGSPWAGATTIQSPACCKYPLGAGGGVLPFGVAKLDE